MFTIFPKSVKVFKAAVTMANEQIQKNATVIKTGVPAVEAPVQVGTETKTEDQSEAVAAVAKKKPAQVVKSLESLSMKGPRKPLKVTNWVKGKTQNVRNQVLFIHAMLYRKAKDKNSIIDEFSVKIKKVAEADTNYKMSDSFKRGVKDYGEDYYIANILTAISSKSDDSSLANAKLNKLVNELAHALWNSLTAEEQEKYSGSAATEASSVELPKLESDSLAAAAKSKAKAKVTKKPTKAVIGIFYNYYKRPLNYLFTLLKKARKSADEKSTIKSLMTGLRKAEAKYQKENNFSDSIVDLLVNQRSLKLGKLEASFDPALSAVVEAKADKGAIGIFYNLHKRPLNYLFVLLKKARKNVEEKGTIADLLKGLRRSEKSYMKQNKVDDSILDTLFKQRKLAVPKAA